MGRDRLLPLRGVSRAAPQRRAEHRRDRHDRGHDAAARRAGAGAARERVEGERGPRADRARGLPLPRRDQGRDRGARARSSTAIPHVTGGRVLLARPARSRSSPAELRGDLAGSIDELNSNPLPPSFNLTLDDPDNLEAVRASLLPPNSAGKPTPISAAIDPPIGEDRENATKIREVTGRGQDRPAR